MVLHQFDLDLSLWGRFTEMLEDRNVEKGDPETKRMKPITFAVCCPSHDDHQSVHSLFYIKPPEHSRRNDWCKLQLSPESRWKI